MSDFNLNLAASDSDKTPSINKIEDELKSSAGPYIIAGLVAVGLAIFLFFWCYIKPKRERQSNFVSIKSMSKASREKLLKGVTESQVFASKSQIQEY